MPAEPRSLTATNAPAPLLPAPAPASPLLGYDGLAPGRVLRARPGEEVALRLVNNLDQPTTLHWHGLRVENRFCGVAGLTQDAVAPGSPYECRFTPRDTGLTWFHPHCAGMEGQIGRGLLGVLIVEEAEPPACDHDLAAVLADWNVDPKTGALAPFAGDHLGTVLSVNARAAPATRRLQPGARIRLRILNAAVARIMVLRFDGLAPMILAIDGQPCDGFAPVENTIPVGPGARFDVMFDLPRIEDAEARLTLRGVVDQPMMIFKTEGPAREALPPIASLPANPNLPPQIRLQDSTRLDVVIEGGGSKPFTLNQKAAVGLSGAASPIFAVKTGTPVTLGLINKTAVAQAIRVHGHHMRLLHPADDGWEPYWRDSILLTPGKTHHVAFLADNPGKWMLESAIYAHQAAGVRAWFEVG